MKLLLLLLVAFLGAVSCGTPSKMCSMKGTPILKGFHKKNMPVYMPCKYHAVRQRCGRYNVTITPGNIYIAPFYRLNTMWLGILEVATGKVWEGRTTNKRVVKFFNGNTSDLFVKKSGNLDTSEVLTFSRGEKETLITNDDFEIVFVPWDPDNKKFKKSSWSFECKATGDFTPAGYPQQVCGAGDLDDFKERRTNLTAIAGIVRPELTSDQAIMFDVFNETMVDITQTDTQCEQASRILKENCTTDAMRVKAIVACGQILTDKGRRRCATKYSCGPMDVFVNCLEWACSDFSDKDACERLGAGIDMCREFRDGNLTGLVQAANCYKDFIPILS